MQVGAEVAPPTPVEIDEQYILSTVTKQAINQLAQDENGKVVLAEKGEKWTFETIPTTEIVDTRAIIAPKVPFPTLCY